MRDVLSYIFNPQKIDPEASKSAYKSSVKPTYVMLTMTIIVVTLFIIATFVYKSIFLNSLYYHRTSYIVILALSVIWLIIARFVHRDYDNRYKIMYFLNAALGIIMFAWVITLFAFDVFLNGEASTILFMTMSLLVPLLVYMSPLQYLIIAMSANVAMIVILRSAIMIGETTNRDLINFAVFSIFQVVMGIVMLYTRYSLHKEIVTETRQNQEIENLIRSQNSFFSNMSHEIRTPINTIIGLNEMILREDVSDEVTEDAANIKAAGKLLLNLINDILDMSKFQSGNMDLLKAPYHTGDMLSDIVGMLWIRAKEKKLEFHVDVSPDVPAELEGDEVRIKQILINVINNAIKYTKEGSVSLSVQCEMREDKICNMIYTVTDTGIGIKTEDIPYLFSAFKRVDENANKHIEGTGLGLSIVKQLIDLMGGKITVNSVYTKGSTFIIEIPQKIEGQGVVGEYDFEKTKTIGHVADYTPKFEAPEARVLVVDDNESNLLVVSKLLRDTKIKIDTVTSGEEALRKTLNIKYDVIFMDHLMPKMDGIECRRRIIDQTGGRSRESKIVILTANADEENRELYARERFDGYLTKPVSGDDLENELYKLLPKELVHITGNRNEIAEETISWMNAGRKRKRVVITTESVADLPQEICEKYDIAILPHKVNTAEGTFMDGKEVDTAGVIKYMEDETRTVMPLAPDVRETEEFFAKQLTSANNVIHISISSKLENSGCPTAIEASKSFDSVIVFDSSHLSSGQGILVIEACKMAEEGKTPEEIIAALEILKKKVHTSFIVDNLDFLARSKQVGQGIANIVKSLMGRPVLELKKGKMGVGKIYFGSRQHAWKKYIDSTLTSFGRIDKKVLFVTYVGINKKEMDWIRAQIEKKAEFEHIYFVQASPAIAVNCGPGTFGLLLKEV
ncbi:MAG: DegV family EDD domain-containing protein [Clostridiales bacterium]|nr:DegV family EDD domain-containing protein [Clostridiales bacterium]